MLTFLTWLWKPHPQYRSQFSVDHVNVLAAMVRRHYPHPHVFKCVTDMPHGIDLPVEIVPAWNDFSALQSQHGPASRQPCCYRRLRLFHPEVGAVLGERVVSMDLDTVIVGDLTPLFDRPEDFVCWKEQDSRSFYNGSLMMLKTGSRPQVWTRFEPRNSPIEAKRAGRFGSDQGWISHCLGKGEATWSTKDGVYSYRCDIVQKQNGRLPNDAVLVNFHGAIDPWSHQAQRLAWVKAHWRH